MKLPHHHSKRGRPRLDRQIPDHGTEELQRKRQFLTKSPHGKDHVHAESLLGVLYARNLLSRPLYEAGCFFKKLSWNYHPCLGTVFRRPSHSLFLRYGPRSSSEISLSEKEERRRIDAWRKALNVLYMAGANPYRVVLSVVLYEGDLYMAPKPGTIKARELTFLKKGLTQLDLYFTESLRDGVNKLAGQARGRFQATTFQPSLREPPLSAPQESVMQEYHDP